MLLVIKWKKIKVGPQTKVSFLFFEILETSI